MTGATGELRIDKWLWAVRLFKTRSEAASACRAGEVLAGDQPVKPSRTVRVGDVYTIRFPDILRTVRVLALLHNRVGAKLAPESAEDQTPASEYLRQMKIREDAAAAHRTPGLGRPTKKDRRAIDDFFA